MDAGTNALSKTLQQSLDEVTGIIAGASEQLATQMTQSTTAAATRMGTIVSSATQDLADAGVEAASRISGSLQGLRAASESLDRSTRQSERVLAGMTTFVGQINDLRNTVEAVLREIARIATPVANAAQDIRMSSQKTADTTARVGELVGNVKVLVGTLEQHQQSVATAWANYQDRFESIDQSLSHVFRQIDEGLSRYCEQVKRFANELDQTTAQTIQGLAGATDELNQSIEDLTEIFHNRR